MAKTLQKLYINQLESMIMRKFYSECIIGILVDDTMTDEKFFTMDIPIIAILSDTLMALNFVKVEYVPVKNITCDPNKIITYLEFRLKTKPYKDAVYKNQNLVSYIRNFYEQFMKLEYNNISKLFIEILREASEKAKGISGLTKPNTVH